MLHLISKAKKLINVHNVSLYTNEAENTVAFLCAAMSTDGCGPFTNYLSPPVHGFAYLLPFQTEKRKA